MCVCYVYACVYPLVYDSIDSEHNLKVVGWVAEEVPSGNDYSRADVISEFSALAQLYTVYM